GTGYGLRPAPVPTHRILILIVALSHPDRRATHFRALSTPLHWGSALSAQQWPQKHGTLGGVDKLALEADYRL
ncbi:hypothetical protein, partial [Novosphingobium sp. 1529]|uniref:hypothetical protein n=1 Tax=Novosphingobium sp. 1529 TaxID=3156424 RepID=UPI00339B03FE